MDVEQIAAAADAVAARLRDAATQVIQAGLGDPLAVATQESIALSWEVFAHRLRHPVTPDAESDSVFSWWVQVFEGDTIVDSRKFPTYSAMLMRIDAARNMPRATMIRFGKTGTSGWNEWQRPPGATEWSDAVAVKG